MPVKLYLVRLRKYSIETAVASIYSHDDKPCKRMKFVLYMAVMEVLMNFICNAISFLPK
jgi:hypothetical protein